MTRKRLKELWLVMEAWKNGKTVQFRFKGDSGWTDDNGTDEICLPWSDHHEYRIKPKPREFWVNFYENCHSQIYLDKKSADQGAISNRLECIHLVEVLK